MRRRSFATVLVGQSALLREGLTRILDAADFRIVASAPRVDDLVLTALPRHRSVLLIIDAGDDLDAAGGQVALFKERHPAARIAVLADHNHPSEIVSAFRVGANAYFIKVAPCDAFIKSLELVMLGETILPAAILSMILDRAGDEEEHHERESVARDVRKRAGEWLEPESNYTPRLSVREGCILKCLIEGDSNKAIARKIDIAEATVKVHVKAILRKIRVHNRTQAAIWAMSNGSSISAMAKGSSAPAEAAAYPSLTSPLVRPLPVTRQNGSALLLPAVTQLVEEARPSSSVDRWSG
jgi:two-component system, NarL family, nitrate/nitrite response regulator NarL